MRRLSVDLLRADDVPRQRLCRVKYGLRRSGREDPASSTSDSMGKGQRTRWVSVESTRKQTVHTKTYDERDKTQGGEVTCVQVPRCLHHSHLQASPHSSSCFGLSLRLAVATVLLKFVSSGSNPTKRKCEPSTVSRRSNRCHMMCDQGWRAHQPTCTPS